MTRMTADIASEITPERPPPRTDPANWIEEFRRRNGRAPSVLHIGNIANNAYYNACLLNAAGMDCDVLCYDYYHIMSCPEWEDADFDGDFGDDFRPFWPGANTRDFRRPRWFAQGRARTCIAYLKAKRSGRPVLASILWKLNAADSAVRALVSRQAPNRREPLWRAIQFVSRHFSKAFYATRYGSNTMLRHTSVLLSHRTLLLSAAVLALVIINEVKGLIAPNVLLITLGALFFAYAARAEYRARRWRRMEEARRRERRAEEAVASRLADAFEKKFPGREADIAEDLIGPFELSKKLCPLLRAYDIVQGYSTDPIYPLLCGVPYAAFEHGTLRDIPFEDTARGRLCSLSYHLASVVFVTNSDCLDKARAIAGGEVVFLNHPFDEDHAANVRGAEELRAELCRELDADFLVFFPTRHDWVAGSGYADKANDMLLRAAATARREGIRIGLICCEWGANVRQSRDLISAEGLARNVKWKRPMGTIAFERTVLACDVVADQFKLGSFGGVFFKAMAAGRAICTFLDETAMRRRYGEPPPVLNANSEETILEQFRSAARDRSMVREIGEAGRRWIKRHYAKADTIRLQLECYEKMLSAPTDRARS